MTVITWILAMFAFPANNPNAPLHSQCPTRSNFSLSEPDPAGTIQRRMKRLTGTKGRPRDDFGDPSTPDFSKPGVVRVYTTNNMALVWRSSQKESAIDKFLRGTVPQQEAMDLVDSDGETPLEGWDISVWGDYLYAGVMTPPEGAPYAEWPQDAWRRRVNAFYRADSKWVRIPDSVFEDPSDQPSWIGHNYGHHFLQDDNGVTWMFYEKVSDDSNDAPWITELFARRMLSPLTLDETEYSIFSLDSHNQWPSLRRHFGGMLAEGGRPVKVGDSYVLGFSGGDYSADDYGIHFLWSTKIQGPYAPYLNDNGTDLKSFGERIENAFPMIWGAARPALFKANGDWWILFHGILEADHRQVEAGFRDVYLAPVEITINKKARPTIEVCL